jgi:hypothetical protein
MDGFHDIAPLRLSPVLGMIGDFRKPPAIGGYFLLAVALEQWPCQDEIIN